MTGPISTRSPTLRLGAGSATILRPWSSYPHWSDPKTDLVAVQREDALRVERDLRLQEFQNPTWSISQALGWFAYRDQDEFRSLEPRDLQRRRFLASEYPKDWPDPDPIGALTSALLDGKLKVRRDRRELTELEIGEIIRGDLWTYMDLWSHPEDVKKMPANWPPRLEKVYSATEMRATKILVEYLKKNGAQTETVMFAYLTKEVAAPLSMTGFRERILPAALQGAGVASRGPGRPRTLKRSPKTTHNASARRACIAPAFLSETDIARGQPSAGRPDRTEDFLSTGRTISARQHHDVAIVDRFD